MSIYLTGASGFVGNSVLNYFSKEKIIKHKRNEKIKIESASIVIHLAGKAHDIKNTSSQEDYYQTNTEFTKKMFNAFLMSDAEVFIFISSVKAVADEVEGELTEKHIPNPITHYGKSKLMAENYIFSTQIPERKRVYVLRPCMIHGPGNKGNLNLLYKLVSKNIPWPLGTFNNKRSFCSIDNLLFIIKELIERNDINSGIYNIADDKPISTNELICIIARSQNKKPKILYISNIIIKMIAILGDLFFLPLNSERLQKLTSSYVVSNKKIKHAINKQLPCDSITGLIYTFESMKTKYQ